MSVKRLLMVALAVPIIIIQEELLLMVPNFQFTVLLIILFSSIFTLRESILLILVYVLIDSMYMGALNPLYMIPMILGWSLIPFSIHTYLKGTKSEIKLALFAFGFGFVYGWMFIPFKMLEQGITTVWPYFVADLPFEIIMAVTGFMTVILLFKPLYKVLKEFDTEDLHTFKKVKSN
jgi:hypothetical protein